MAIRIGADIPSLADATEWINGQIATDDLIGHPALVHFWAVSCGTCSEQMPQVVRWHEQMATRGMRFVAVHMPRSERDTELDPVREAVSYYGLPYPVAVDNLHAITDRFDNKYVPAFYLFDADGHLRQYAAGEQGIALLQKAMDRVMARAEERRDDEGVA